jgi:hypothetical protein
MGTTTILYKSINMIYTLRPILGAIQILHATTYCLNKIRITLSSFRGSIAAMQV